MRETLKNPLALSAIIKYLSIYLSLFKFTNIFPYYVRLVDTVTVCL